MDPRDLHLVVRLAAQGRDDDEVLVLPRLPGSDGPAGNVLPGLTGYPALVDWVHGADRYVLLVGELDEGLDVAVILARCLEDLAFLPRSPGRHECPQWMMRGRGGLSGR